MSGWNAWVERTLVGLSASRRAVAILSMVVLSVGGAFIAISASGSSARADAPAASARRCVGMFISPERRQVTADSKSLEVIGTIPCAERGVMAWTMQGPHRVFEDGTVEFLATPSPPCPEGDSYVWIRYPNPGH